MPRFMPVQCHKCSVLQIKPAQKRGLHWCCSMCRSNSEPRGTPAAASPGASAASRTPVVMSDVSLFVEELNVPWEEEEAKEMGPVANTFRGVECLDGASNCEALYYQSSKVQQQALVWRRSVNPSQIFEDGFAEVEERSSSIRNRETGQKGGGQFLSSLWQRWQQKAAKKDVVELIEFARGLGNEENLHPRS